MPLLEQLIEGIQRKKEDIFLQYGRIPSDKLLLVMRKDDMHELFKMRYNNKNAPHITLTAGYMLKVMDIKIITAPEEVLKGKLFHLTMIT
ncbi:hypothetical protein [Pragia fontium]|uniref:Uncharacterized protein n=2 Tax=Pragia fontium TaxID=82985 RepID=A0AAJ5BGU2_9GAMM|nr:hypothetical protein [Pragia fontium]AKJ43204.1 hypothetical protein QQ39_14960 [Pragia fontium]SFC63116.1 hypothetical protein SAMN02745723_103160 [Pragia fontium DSM 5563 = ATCC 49100]SUB83646.1 Uncharacterised protein [Pragia fontium]VEJ56552.1 Uncharacterised protein [Pragia fontium]GKX63413.1 hypothetical protein SOASR032_19820 [Pragia fontium]